MRDIREDLKERLEDIERQRTEIQQRLAELSISEEKISALLQLEKERWEAELEASMPLFTMSDPEEISHGGKYSSPVAKFVLSFLNENKDATLEMLKRGAAREGIPFGGKNPGRSIHFLLTGMQQNGLVEKSDSGRWTLKNEKGH